MFSNIFEKSLQNQFSVRFLEKVWHARLLINDAWVLERCYWESGAAFLTEFLKAFDYFKPWYIFLEFASGLSINSSENTVTRLHF